MSIPRPEHPRPDFERNNWINLNGEWQFEIDHSLSGAEKGWSSGMEFSRRILVPFPPESTLSGIDEKDFMGSVWYRRFFDVPEDWLEKHILLNFGAVDYETMVWMNGNEVGHHRGGYTPFRCDITNMVRKQNNELVVWALDDCCYPGKGSGIQPSGKQSFRLKSSGCMYTRVTGIWQTVWVESVPRTYIESFCLTTYPYTGDFFVRVKIGGQPQQYTLSIIANAEGEPIAADASFHEPLAELKLKIPSPRLWSPKDPYLYDLSLQVKSKDGIDIVKSYFGMREIHIIGNRILLNNKSCFLRLVLDQGYYPDGIYTAPSDEALRRDIELSMAMGFDGARLHQKIFEPRFLYWADKLGYLVTGEFPDWGTDLSKTSAREAIVDEWIQVLERDFNHPSIIIWTPLNERPKPEEAHLIEPEGATLIEKAKLLKLLQFFRMIVKITKTIDPTRPVIDTSWGAHILETDIYDIHGYEKKRYEDLKEIVEKASRQPIPLSIHGKEKYMPPYRGQPFMVSECGGGWWGKTVEEYINKYKVMTESLRSNPAISGFCIVQLYDIDKELNGLYTYDRKPKVDPEIIREINRKIAEIEK